MTKTKTKIKLMVQGNNMKEQETKRSCDTAAKEEVRPTDFSGGANNSCLTHHGPHEAHALG